MPTPFTHCTACGARLPAGEGWPRTCAGCGHVTHRNPLPVAVLLVPVTGGGVLLVRRAIPPTGLALPGGYIELGESWQSAAARELAEETGLRVDPAAIGALAVHSAPDGTLLVFGSSAGVEPSALRGFAPSAEVAGIEVVDAPRSDVVFPLHAEVLADWFASTPAA